MLKQFQRVVISKQKYKSLALHCAEVINEQHPDWLIGVEFTNSPISHGQWRVVHLKEVPETAPPEGDPRGKSLRPCGWGDSYDYDW